MSKPSPRMIARVNLRRAALAYARCFDAAGEPLSPTATLDGYDLAAKALEVAATEYAETHPRERVVDHFAREGVDRAQMPVLRECGACKGSGLAPRDPGDPWDRCPACEGMGATPAPERESVLSVKCTCADCKGV